MGRIVYCPIESDTVAAGGDTDLFELKAGASNKLKLLGFEVNSNAVAAVATELKLYRSTNAGTGGTVGVEVLADEDDGTITAACVNNVTTPGTTGAVEIMHFGWEQLGPLKETFTPEMGITVQEGQYIKLNLITNTAFTCNGWVCWEEI